MTTTHYLHPSAKALTGARLGLGWLDRLEALGITKASAAPRHTHESMEILCCLKGVIGYAFDRWPSVTMTAGCFLVVPEDAGHRITSGLESPSLRMSFFFRLFRRHAGCSPAAYRRQSIASSVASR